MFLFDFFLDFGWILRAINPQQTHQTKGSSVELPSNFQFVTTKCAKYEQVI